MKINSTVIVCLFCLIYTQSAFAYLDPGTGSLMLQMMIAGILGGLATIKLYWYRIKSFFGKDVDKSDSEKFNTEDSTPGDD